MDQKAIDAAKEALIGHFPDFKSFEEGGEEYNDREDTYKREGLKEFQQQMSPYVEGSRKFNADEDVNAIVNPLFKLTNFVNWRDIGYINGTLLSGPGAWVDFIQLMLACLRGAATNQWEKPLEDVLSFLASRNCNANITKLLPTFFLFNWDSRHHIFIKPRVCLKFLRRLGEGVGKAGQAMSVDEYRRILGVFENLKRLLVDWKPRDFVDLQSFYYIVEGYGDPEEEEMAEVKPHSEETTLPSGPETRRNTSINLILYGPPGTGKTYQTIERAVKIIEPGFAGARSEFKERFDELARLGRIGFITFHQSYAYEDFVEGIRPVLDDEEERDLPRYECRAGIFKRLATNALFDCLETAEAAKELIPFDVLWSALLSQVESEPDREYPGLTEKTRYQLEVTMHRNIEARNVVNPAGGNNYHCTRKVVEEVFDAKRNQDSVTASEVIEVARRGCHSHLVAAVFNELKRIEKVQKRGKAPLKREVVYTDEQKADVVQRFLADKERSGHQFKREAEWNRYVLVIDEINRGNISKILGELITLLEPDKRLPGDNSLIATLPYSGERFAVPANVSVLATMNTTDKSIALVDLALRRRFEFEELVVDLSVCPYLKDHMQAVLRELNRRIALRKDRDHLIGHAYFIRVNDELSFNLVFRRQIIPLLQEYFYNDWEGLRFVLSEPTDGKGGFIGKIAGEEVREARNKWQWFFDASGNLNCLDTLCKNYHIEQ